MGSQAMQATLWGRRPRPRPIRRKRPQRPPPGAPGPFTLSENRNLEELLTEAGFHITSSTFRVIMATS